MDKAQMKSIASILLVYIKYQSPKSQHDSNLSFFLQHTTHVPIAVRRNTTTVTKPPSTAEFAFNSKAALLD